MMSIHNIYIKKPLQYICLGALILWAVYVLLYYLWLYVLIGFVVVILLWAAYALGKIVIEASNKL